MKHVNGLILVPQLILFEALYIIFRGTLVPYMVWHTWPESEVPLLVKITATGLFL